VDTLLLDKTGTITMGNRRATRFVPAGAYSAADLGRLAALASLADQTPEGKSVLDLYQRLPAAPGGQQTSSAIMDVPAAWGYQKQPPGPGDQPGFAGPAVLEAAIPSGARFVEFTAQTRMSGIDLPDGPRVRKGAPDTILRHVRQLNGHV